MRHVPFALLPCLLLLSSLSLAQGPTLPVVRRVNLVDDAIPVSKALDEIRRQVGVRILNELPSPDRDVSLQLRQASFWQAVDAVAAAGGGVAVLSPRDGSVVVRRRQAGERMPPTSYDGDFRVRILRISATREFDSERTSCVVSFELTWTPTLRPVLLDTQPQGLQFLDSKGKAVEVPELGSSLAPVDGRFALTFDLALPGLPRGEPHVGLLAGRFVAVAPTRMLAFRYDADLKTLQGAVADGAQRRLVEDGVRCTIDRVVLARDRWSVRVALDYPAGNRQLESFQAGSLVANNELTLVSRDGKRQLSPSSSAVDLVSSRRAVVTYHFADRPGASRGRADDWRPRYHAPARLVDVPFQFRFTRVPLP